MIELGKVHLISISTSLCQRTTMLNADACFCWNMV